MRLLVLALMAVSLFGCNGKLQEASVNKEFLNQFEKFQNEYDLKGVTREDATDVVVPGSYVRMVTNDKFLVVYDQFAKAGKFFYVYDKKSYKLASSFGSPGPGPREGNVAGKFYYRHDKGEIVQYIADKAMVLKYNLDSALSNKVNYLPTIEYVNLKGFFQAAPGQNYYSLLIRDPKALEPDSTIFKITSRYTGLEASHGERFLPSSAFEDFLGDLEFNYASLAVNQDQSKAVVSYLKWDKLGFVDLLPPNRTFFIDGPDNFDPARNASGLIMRDFNAKWGYGDVSLAGDFIFCAYLGKPKWEAGKAGIEVFPNEVHVFDWQGRAVAKLTLDHLTQGITVDWERKLLISIDPTVQNGIVEYDLSSLAF